MSVQYQLVDDLPLGMQHLQSKNVQVEFFFHLFHILTFNDPLLLIFDLPKAQPLGLLRLVDQPRVRSTLTCTTPASNESRPVRQRDEKIKINFCVCELTEK